MVAGGVEYKHVDIVGYEGECASWYNNAVVWVRWGRRCTAQSWGGVRYGGEGGAQYSQYNFLTGDTLVQTVYSTVIQIGCGTMMRMVQRAIIRTVCGTIRHMVCGTFIHMACSTIQHVVRAD